MAHSERGGVLDHPEFYFDLKPKKVIKREKMYQLFESMKDAHTIEEKKKECYFPMII